MKKKPTRINSINVIKFRGLENITINFGKRITAICGKNGTSKSTILGILAQVFNFREDVSVNPPIKLSDYKTLTDKGFKSEFSEHFRFSEKHVIGGKKQDGNWKLDARFNKNNLIKRIRSIGDNKSKISVFNLDAIEFIDRVVKNLPKRSLTYIDPPYYVKGEGLYENHYGHNDHVAIANKIINEIKSPWVVSYDNVKEIDIMYNGCKTLDYELHYSAQERKKGKELMFFSDELRVPKIKNPAKCNA